MAAAMAVPAITGIIEKEPGGLMGIVDSIAMKPFYFICSLMLLIGLIVFVSGKYPQGFMLMLVSGGVLGVTYYMRVKASQASIKRGSGRSYFGRNEDHTINYFDGGKETIKESSLLTLNNVLQLPPVDGTIDESILLSNIMEHGSTAISNYNALTDIQQSNVKTLLNNINDKGLEKLLFKHD